MRSTSVMRRLAGIARAPFVRRDQRPARSRLCPTVSVRWPGFPSAVWLGGVGVIAGVKLIPTLEEAPPLRTDPSDPDRSVRAAALQTGDPGAARRPLLF